MAVKYVNDFAFDSGFGFSGSSGKTPVKSHMRSPMKKGVGGAVKAGPKAPAIAPAMVEKRSQGLGGLAKETKKLASYDKPHMEGKKGAKVPQYAKGGAVKKAHAKKEMPSFLKAKMMKKADGGEIIAPMRPDDGIVYENNAYQLQRDLDEVRNAEDPTYEERMERLRLKGSDIWPGSTRESIMPTGEDVGLPQALNLTPEERDRLRIRGDSAYRAADLQARGIMPQPSPLARAARMAARREMMGDRRDIMDQYIAGPRRAMPAPRRAMPVAPRRPMIDRSMPQPYMPTYTPPTREESDAYLKAAGIVPSVEARYAKGGAVKKGQAKVGKVMGEFKRGELHSGSKQGPVVKNPKQAVAIALSEARQAGAKIPKKKAMGGRACD